MIRLQCLTCLFMQRLLRCVEHLLCISCKGKHQQVQGSDMKELSDLKEGTSQRSGEQATQPRIDAPNWWILIAIAIDRLFLVVYIVLTVMLVVTLVINYPFMKD